MIEELFKSAGSLVGGAALIHGGFAWVGARLMEFSDRKKWARSSQSLSVEQIKGLQDGLSRVMGARAPDFTLLGISDHDGDARPLSFLAHPDTLKILVEKGIRHIAIELPPTAQAWIDAKCICDESIEFAGDVVENYVHYQDDQYRELINNADKAGISVVAADVSRGGLLNLFKSHAIAACFESRLLGKLNKNVACSWAKSSMRSYARYRLAGDKRVASYIKKQAAEGSTLIFWGAGHVFNDLPNSFRKSFPDALTLSFGMPSDENKGSERSMQSTDACGLPVRPVDFILDLTSATVRDCRSTFG